MPPFDVISRRSTPVIVLSRKLVCLFFQNSASKLANWIIVDIVKYLMLSLEKSLQLIFNFLFP